MRCLIGRLAASSSVLLSTHLVDDVGVVADRTIVLDEGQVSFSGGSAELAGRDRPGAAGDSPLSAAAPRCSGRRPDEL